MNTKDKNIASGGPAAAGGASGWLSRAEIQQSRLDRLENAYWSAVYTLDCLRAESCDYLGRYNSQTDQVRLEEQYAYIDRIADLMSRQRSVMENECRIESGWWAARIGDDDLIEPEIVIQ